MNPVPALAGFAGRRPKLSAWLLGLLSAAALPPIHAIPVLALCLPGLFYLLALGRGWRNAFAVGFMFGFGEHLLGLYWITEAIMIESARFWWLVPIAVPMLAAVLALFVAAPCALAATWPARGRLWLLVGAWILAELARQFVLSGFPWNPLGSIWAIPGPLGNVMIQPAAVVGVHGLTAGTLLLGFALARGRRGAAAAAIGLAAWAAFGLWRLGPNPPGPNLAVVLVQGDIDQAGKWNRDRALRIFETYLDLTRAGRRAAAARYPRDGAVTIWPETASPFLVDRDPDARAAIAEAADGPALVGSIRFDAANRPYNSLVAVEGRGPAAAVYDKWHLVPFGEYQPGWFPLPIAFVTGDGFGRGPGPQTLHVPGLPAYGALICYEAIFPGEIVAAERPAWLVNVTNDAWFGNSTGPRQHLAAARLRAVEEGLPLMRAANTGISAGFDGYGRELGRLGMEARGSLVLPLPGPLSATPFARFGLWIDLALALAAIAAGLIIGLPRARA
jgi:apolipoprotein N-acyltransferase